MTKRRGWGLCPGAGEGVSPPGSAPPHSHRFPLHAKVPFPAPCCSRAPGLRQRRRGRRDLLPASESGRGADLAGAASPGTSRVSGCSLWTWEGTRPFERTGSPSGDYWPRLVPSHFIPCTPLRFSSSHSLESSVCPGGDGSNGRCLEPNFHLARRLTPLTPAAQAWTHGTSGLEPCWIFVSVCCFVENHQLNL